MLIMALASLGDYTWLLVLDSLELIVSSSIRVYGGHIGFWRRLVYSCRLPISSIVDSTDTICIGILVILMEAFSNRCMMVV